MVEESIEESSPTEIGIEGLPKNLSDLVLKADAAIGQNNLGYAVKLLISVLKMFKYLRLNEQTNMLWAVLTRAGRDIAFFMFT